MINGMVISLCDYTGNMVKPWLEAGYEAFIVDPQHETTTYKGGADEIRGNHPRRTTRTSQDHRKRQRPHGLRIPALHRHGSEWSPVVQREVRQGQTVSSEGRDDR